MIIEKLSNHLQSVTTQIFAIFWFTFTLLLLLAFFIPSLDNRVYSALTSEQLETYQKQIVTSIRTNQISRLLVAPAKFAIDSTAPIRPILMDSNKRIIGALPDELPTVQQFVLQSANVSAPMVRNFNNIQLAGPFIVHLNTPENEPFLLYFVKTVNPQKEGVNFIFDHPALIVFLIMLFSSPILWWLAWRIAHPLRRLQHFAGLVSKGDFTLHKELEESGVYELRQLSKSLNQMTESLDNLLSTRQALLYSISHELRTPLTRLQLAVALIRRRQGESRELTRIETEAERLDQMINDLLQLSRNQLKSELERERFPITEIWQDVLEDTKFEAKQRNIHFKATCKIPDVAKYAINGNRSALASALENILRNALKYTNTSIEATFRIENNCLRIDIDDDGIGVPESEYSKIFTPFYRVDTARTRSTGGTGLGLAIVLNIIKQHHGEIGANKSRLKGLCITMKLPLDK